MGKKTIKGENDLKTWCENNGEWGKQIAEEWVGEDEDGNPVEIDDIAGQSSRKVKWKCRSCNNQWVTTIADRTCLGGECKICRIKLGEWCDSNGEYGKQLKNEWTGKYRQGTNVSETTIERILRLSSINCIWKCQRCGKEFEAKPFRRIMYKEGCPNCSVQNNVSVEQQPSNTSLIEWCGKNNLMDKLFSVWTGQNENNESISLNDISVDSDVKLQWKCDKGHTYIDTNPLNSSRQSLLEFSRRRRRRGLYKTAIGFADCNPRSGRSPKLQFLLEFRGIV